jgi:ABC-type dipeptide/oligopeptide/nickel transport system permease subunit
MAVSVQARPIPVQIAARRGRGELWTLVRRNRLLTVGVAILVLLAFVMVTANFIAPYDPIRMNVGAPQSPPSAQHWFGTDRFGRDVLSRIMYGTRVSLLIAFVSVLVAVIVGSGLGIVAAYYEGPVDSIAGRVMDIFLSFPALLLAIAIAAMLGPSELNVILAISVVYCPRYFRVARAPALAEKHIDYVEAARALGEREHIILIRHVVPNIVSPVIVQSAIGLSAAILIEASLGYLGLGVQPPSPSWGTMLNEGRTFLQTAPWLSIFPGLAIFLAVLAFNLVGDGLRDYLDPRTRAGM